MNERIKELAEQTGGIFSPLSGRNLDNFNVVEFAELIIKECMEHALEIGRLNPNPRCEMTCRSVSDRISIKMLGIYPPTGPIKAPPRGVDA